MAKLSDLIAEYQVHDAAFNAAVTYTDSVHGTALAASAEDSQSAALEVLEASVLAICAYRTIDPTELSAKASFLMKWIGGIDSLQGDEARALLGSMIEEAQSMNRIGPDFADLKGLADAAYALHEAGCDIGMDQAASLGLYAIEWSLLAICTHKPSRDDLLAWRKYLLNEVVGHMESDLGFTHRVVALLSGMPREELETLLAEIGDSPIDRYRPKGGAT